MGDTEIEDRRLTEAQFKALMWFAFHGGDGMRQSGGLILAAGELSPFMGRTLNALGGMDFLEKYGDRRIRITAAGRAFLALHDVQVRRL